VGRHIYNIIIMCAMIGKIHFFIKYMILYIGTMCGDDVRAHVWVCVCLLYSRVRDYGGRRFAVTASLDSGVEGRYLLCIYIYTWRRGASFL